MKATLNGIVYDTDTAERLADVTHILDLFADGARQYVQSVWQRFCFRKTDGECCFVVRKTLYLNGAAHSNDQFLGYGKAKAVSGGCSGRIALI